MISAQMDLLVKNTCELPAQLKWIHIYCKSTAQLLLSLKSVPSSASAQNKIEILSDTYGMKVTKISWKDGTRLWRISFLLNPSAGCCQPFSWTLEALVLRTSPSGPFMCGQFQFKVRCPPPPPPSQSVDNFFPFFTSTSPPLLQFPSRGRSVKCGILNTRAELVLIIRVSNLPR